MPCRLLNCVCRYQSNSPLPLKLAILSSESPAWFAFGSHILGAQIWMSWGQGDDTYACKDKFGLRSYSDKVVSSYVVLVVVDVAPIWISAPRNW
jgi:hypothetical protein